MTALVDHMKLHRTAKVFMDDGRAATDQEAMALLRRFGLTIVVGPDIATSADQQIALLTLVNTARRTLLGGVEVLGIPHAAPRTNLTSAETLAAAVAAFGGRAVEKARGEWPTALIGEVVIPAGSNPASWRLAWEGRRGGVVPANEPYPFGPRAAMPLAPVLAASMCAAEAFASHAGDHPMAGRRAAGISLWDPSRDWLASDLTEPEIAYLPSRLWLIGLGNLGQAYAWLLGCLPYPDRNKVELVLQDFDRLAESNDSTSLLSSLDDIGVMKTRAVAAWLEQRGFRPFLEEPRFGEWTRRAPHEPGVGLCGVDNALARAALEKAGFNLVVEAGLGAGPQGFRNMSLHTFPATRSAAQIWSGATGNAAPDVSSMPAYAALKKSGADACGLAQIASRSVGVPFVGLLAGLLVFAELLRRLHGGLHIEVMSLSALAPDDVEFNTLPTVPYAFGHLQICS